MLIPGSSSLPPIVPTDGWAPGLAGIPASMKHTLYRVELCFQKRTADIVAARCSYPAGSAACSHVAGTLFTVKDYVANKDQQSCTTQLQYPFRSLHDHRFWSPNLWPTTETAGSLPT